MQPRLVIEVLPLKPQVLINLMDGKLLNRPPRPIRRLPDNLALTISQLQRRTNLIGMEVIDLLLFPFRLVNPR
ncbi:hypothetical protein D3C79_867550 [compost metagenome]